MTRRQTWCAAALAALALLLLTGLYLNQQGAYYDELHQAPTSFWYIGSHPPMFTLIFNDIPILNVSYSGAIKSMVYGLYLRVTPFRFTVFSWRLLGILFVAAALISFFLIAGRYLSWAAAAVFSILLVTDANVLVTTRFDWGPTALALALRLLFVAIWFSMDLGIATDRKRFALGLILGIAIFEKVSAIALVVPFLLAFWGSPRFSGKGLLKAGAGGLVGVFPVIYANYSSLRHGGGLVSLASIEGNNSLSLHRAIEFLYQYFALGHGERASGYVFGDQARSFWPQAEAGLLIFLIAFVLILAFRSAGTTRSLIVRLGGAYIAVAVCLFLLPQATNAHHWIQGTPFQYAAIALTLLSLGGRRWVRAIFLAAVGLLLLVRIPNVVRVEQAFVQDRSTPQYDRAYTKLGEFAGANAKNAAFIAADWGTATQIYCLGNGDDQLVYELFWSDDPAASTRLRLSQIQKSTVYVVVSGLSPDFSPASSAVIQAVESSPDWKEEPIESELRELSRVRVRKFVRR